VQHRISRKQDNVKTAENIRWLMTQSAAHLHTDLIFGLPGETIESFAKGFDELLSWQPHEVQFGILKRLRGTPVIRHTDGWRMVYDPLPPYTILQNSAVGFEDMLRIQRFASYWEIVANSGRFAHTLPMLLSGESAFYAFLSWSDWLWAKTGKTHEFALERLIDFLFEHLTQVRGLDAALLREALLTDYTATGARGQPKCLEGLVETRLRLLAQIKSGGAKATANTQRQARHQQGADAKLRDEIQKAAAAA
jgi:hypothetical protein